MVNVVHTRQNSEREPLSLSLSLDIIPLVGN